MAGQGNFTSIYAINYDGVEYSIGPYSPRCYVVRINGKNPGSLAEIKTALSANGGRGNPNLNMSGSKIFGYLFDRANLNGFEVFSNIVRYAFGEQPVPDGMLDELKAVVLSSAAPLAPPPSVPVSSFGAAAASGFGSDDNSGFGASSAFVKAPAFGSLRGNMDALFAAMAENSVSQAEAQELLRRVKLASLEKKISELLVSGKFDKNAYLDHISRLQ